MKTLFSVLLLLNSIHSFANIEENYDCRIKIGSSRYGKLESISVDGHVVPHKKGSIQVSGLGKEIRARHTFAEIVFTPTLSKGILKGDYRLETGYINHIGTGYFPEMPVGVNLIFAQGSSVIKKERFNAGDIVNLDIASSSGTYLDDNIRVGRIKMQCWKSQN